MFFWTPVDALLNLKNKYCMKTAWQRKYDHNDFKQNVVLLSGFLWWFSPKYLACCSLVHILQFNVSARFVSRTVFGDNLLIAVILIYAGKAQLISNLHFHQACSINMRFVWWITKCIIKLLLYFFHSGIFVVKMYFSYLLVFLLEIYFVIKMLFVLSHSAAGFSDII